jgi:hypothetical protein
MSVLVAKQIIGCGGFKEKSGRICGKNDGSL